MSQPGRGLFDGTHVTVVGGTSGIGAAVAQHFARLGVTGRSATDVLVNAAGIISRGADHDPEVFAHVLAVNLTGTTRGDLAT